MPPEKRGDIQMPPDLGRGGKTRLLRKMGFDAPQQFYRYLQPGGPIPTKRILRKISDALELSWPVAALLAGYIDEFFAIAQALCSLGLTWCQEDGLTYKPRVGVVVETEALPEGRYVAIGRYDAELNKVSPMFDYRVVIPNPTAAALILVRARFPRIWETSRAEGNGYWQSVLREIAPMITMAEAILNQTPGRKSIHPLLRRALAVLNDPLILRNRHWIAAEYVDRWAQEISTPFTDYVGFALYHLPILSSQLPDPDVRKLPTPEELARGVS